MKRWAKKNRSCFGELARLGGLVLACLLMAAPWGAGEAQATEIPFTSQALQSLASVHRDDYLTDDFHPLSEVGEQLREPREEPLEVISDLIIAENWDAWMIFQANPALAVPLAEVQIYIVETERVAKRPKVQERRYLAKESRVSEQAWYEEPPPKQRISTTQQDKSLRQGLLEVGTKKAPSGPSGPAGILNWFLDDEGVFSGRPWSWENFLPRALTVTGLVVAALMAVEFLHLVVALGMRTLGRGRGSR
jgi:hypothetical protein